jgi:hypothetical protein
VSASRNQRNRSSISSISSICVLKGWDAKSTEMAGERQMPDRMGDPDGFVVGLRSKFGGM